MPLELRPSDLTERQRKVMALRNKGCSVKTIADRTGFGWSSVVSAIRELEAKERRTGAAVLSVEEQMDRLAATEHRLAASGRCGRCGLLEPHECIHMQADARREVI